MDFKPVIDALLNNRKPEIINITHDDVATAALVLPAGLTAESITKFTDKLLPAPRRKTGSVITQSLDSFCAFVKAHRETSSTIFASAEDGAMTAVINFHDAKADGQRWGDLRVAYAPQMSEEWKAWTAKSGEGMSVPEFAEFIDERIVDIVEPPAKNEDSEGAVALRELAKLYSTTFADKAKVIELSRGLRIHSKDQAETVVNTNSGEQSIEFKSEHQGRDGERLNVPGLFCIAIPVFDRGTVYRLPCRLKYRLLGGKIVFLFELLNKDKARARAIDQMVDKAKTETELPLYFAKAPEPAK